MVWAIMEQYPWQRSAFLLIANLTGLMPVLMPYLCAVILYNVTINIDAQVHEEWLQWMQTHHIPDVLATGMFIENRLCRVEGESEGGVTYAIQYLAPDRAHYERYLHEFAEALQAEHSARYAGQFAAFRTILEVIHQQSS